MVAVDAGSDSFTGQAEGHENHPLIIAVTGDSLPEVRETVDVEFQFLVVTEGFLAETGWRTGLFQWV